MKHKSTPFTKITRPNVSGVCPRKRLFRVLDKQQDFPITYISAPAGSGKTTLTASWLDARKLSCIWYYVDEGDDDISTLFYYMGLAAKRASPKGKKPLPLLTPEYLPAINTFIRRYFEELYSRLTPPRSPSLSKRGKLPPSPSLLKRGSKGGVIIVFDNYQNVHPDSQFHNVLCEGLSIIPEGIHAVLISRRDPPQAFSRLRANNKIGLIGWEDVRFTMEESRKIVSMKSGKGISDDNLTELHKKTEGWAAGLILMTEAANTKKIDHSLIHKLKQEEVFNYFAGEIFEKTDKETQYFLLKTAFFNRMTSKMAEDLTGISHADDILDALNRSHYFTQRDNSIIPVYRYHPLFKDFLLFRAGRYFVKEESSRIKRSAAAILENSGQIEDAALLLMDIKDYDGLIGLILKNAESFIEKGRSRTIVEWIKGLPDETINRAPWILYWLGICQMSFSPAASRRYLEEGYKQFKTGDDRRGLLLSWSGVVNTYLYEWKDFKPLDFWIEELEQIRLLRGFAPRNDTPAYVSLRAEGEAISIFPSKDIEERVTASMFGALMFRQPGHPDISLWEEKVKGIIQESKDNTLKMSTGGNLITYYVWTGQITKAGILIAALSESLKTPNVSPLQKLMCLWAEALYNYDIGGYETSLSIIEEGLKIAGKTGIYLMNAMFYGTGVYSALSLWDIDRAGGFLKKMESALNMESCFAIYYYHHVSIAASCRGESASAIEYAKTALKLAEESGAPFIIGVYTYMLIAIMIVAGKYKDIEKYMSELRRIIEKTKSKFLEYVYLSDETFLSLARGDEKMCLEFFKKAITLNKTMGVGPSLPFSSSTLSCLCAKALSAGIETEYVQEMIRRNNLLPDPRYSGDEWPYPFKIYTLGRFEILEDDKPLYFSGKVQQKPLAMLKAIIVFGGREVGEDQISDALWPDAEGDLAHRSFATTLHRLRKLIGSDTVIQFKEGRLTLDERYCRVDFWVFEKIYERIEASEGGKRQGLKEDEVCLIEKAIAMYKGHLLAKDTRQLWIAPIAERLRNKFLKLVVRLGRYYEHAGEWENALELFQKGLEIDDIIEEFYQHIMLCHKELGNNAEAVKTYNCCSSVLSASLDISPSQKTEEIYKALKDRGF